MQRAPLRVSCSLSHACKGGHRAPGASAAPGKTGHGVGEGGARARRGSGALAGGAQLAPCCAGRVQRRQEPRPGRSHHTRGGGGGGGDGAAGEAGGAGACGARRALRHRRSGRRGDCAVAEGRQGGGCRRAGAHPLRCSALAALVPILSQQSHVSRRARCRRSPALRRDPSSWAAHCA